MYDYVLFLAFPCNSLCRSPYLSYFPPYVDKIKPCKSFLCKYLLHNVFCSLLIFIKTRCVVVLTVTMETPTPEMIGIIVSGVVAGFVLIIVLVIVVVYCYRCAKPDTSIV